MGDKIVTRIARAMLDAGTTTWQTRAECQGMPELMDSTRPPDVFEGLSLCARCPVRAECRAWAEDETDYVGIAGGQVYTTKHGRRVSKTTGLDLPA